MKALFRRFSKSTGTKRTNTPPLVTLFLLVLMGFGWGLDYTLLKIASEAQLPSLGVTTVVGIGGGLILISFSWVRNCAVPVSSQYLRYYAVCGLLSTVGPLFFQMLVARHIPVGVLAIVVTMTPVFTYIFARFFKLEAHSWRRVAGISFGLTAALLLLVPKASLPSSEMRLWVAIGFIVPVLYASYHVFATAQRPNGLNSMQAAAGAFLVAGILVLPISLWQDDLAFLLDPWHQGHWAVAALLVIYSILGMMFFMMLKMVGPVLVSLTNFIGVIAGVGWGMLIFDERPTVWVLGSLSLLILALTLTISFRSDQDIASSR